MKEALLELLRGLPPEFRADFTRSQDSVWVCCPVPEHGGEKTQSFKINIEGQFIGSHFCFGCRSVGKWADTCRVLGLPREAQFLTETNIADSFNQFDLDSMFAGAKPKPKDAHEVVRWERKDDWRGISGKLLHKLEATIEWQDSLPKLILPVLMNKKKVGFVTCNIEKDMTPGALNYINSRGRWAQDALFPYDYVKRWITRDNLDTITIVEGPRDTLHLCQEGYPTVGTLGSNNWSKRCAMYVKSLGVKYAVIMADPDNAGDKLEADIYDDLGDSMHLKTVHLKRLPNGKKQEDPADLSPERLEKIYRKVYASLKAA